MAHDYVFVANAINFARYSTALKTGCNMEMHIIRIEYDHYSDVRVLELSTDLIEKAITIKLDFFNKVFSFFVKQDTAFNDDLCEWCNAFKQAIKLFDNCKKNS